MRKNPTDTPTEFELEDTAADIQRRKEVREQREEGIRETTEGQMEGRKPGWQELHSEEPVLVQPQPTTFPRVNGY